MKHCEAARKGGIGIAPGRIFTLEDKSVNCLRLNAAVWSAAIAQGIETLGGLAGMI